MGFEYRIDVAQPFKLGSPNDLKEWWVEEISRFGLRTGFIVDLAEPGQPIQPVRLFGKTDLVWETEYLKRGLFRYDPVIRCIFRSDNYFSLSSNSVEAITDQERSVLQFATRHGHLDGFVVPLRSARGRIQAAIMTAPRRLALRLEDCAYLAAVATLFVGRARQLTPESGAGNVTLTRRERECLAWVSQSKSDWAIAQILDLSPATVHMHIERARRKFGGVTRGQSALEAWKQGLLVF